MQWKGPYSILRHPDNGVDYLAKVHGKIKLYHINMLKKYTKRERDPDPIDEVKVAQVCIIDSTSKGSNTCDISVLDSSDNCKFDICPSLSSKQVLELNALLSNYSDAFSNDLGLTNTITHDIKLTSDVPVHRKTYPIPHNMLKHFEEEIDRMLNLDITEPSDSPYCSPVVLVEKSDNMWQFCVDFRSLNDISLLDAEPMPTMEEALGDYFKDKYFTEIDLCKGYW